ncbi:MAG: hybrid sensor histidine kinase/response regulator [Thermoleophilaceae bacterium]
MNTLSSRIGPGIALLAASAALMFAALVGAAGHARHVDSGASATAAQADSGVQSAVHAYAQQHPTPTAKSLDGRVASVVAAHQAQAASRSDHLKSGLARWSLVGVLGLIGAVVALALLSRSFSRTLTRPLRALADAVERRVGGDSSAPMPVTGGGDFERLASSVDAIAGTLEQTRKELAEKAAQLESTHEAVDANRAKSEFLSRMSHELRTPLNAILGFAQLLESDQLDSRQRDNVGHIVNGGRHLLDLINEVLEISRLEVGSLRPEIEPVHAATTLREAVELVSPLASQRKIELNMHLGADDDVWVEANQQRLKQVMLNLLANAVKYNREEGSVTVSFKRVDSRLRILVTDTGQGIAQDQVHKLFTPFERLGAESTGVEGTGLGLVLALRLMEAMGGTIGVESQPWIGSTFHTELPITEPAAQPEPEEEERPAFHNPLAMPEPMAAGSGGTILYIEDDLANLRLMSHLFEEAPEFELMTTMQGKLGIELARQHRPELILLDLHLPDIDGHDVIRRLREDPMTRPIPVIVLSADATEETVKRLKVLGAAQYLTKPLQLDVVLNTIREVLANKPRTIGPELPEAA